MSASANDNSTSLGNILVEMGVITEAQLRDAVERQENSSLEQLLGAVLVHHEYCSKEDVEAALSAQKSLRSGKRVKAALAVADIAIHRRATNGARERAIISGARFVRSASSPEYVAITAEMLAKTGGDR